MRKIYSFLFALVSLNAFSQEIQFYFEVPVVAPGALATVNVYAVKSDNTPLTENLTSFNFGFFFNDANAIINGIPTTNTNMNATQLANAGVTGPGFVSSDLTGSVTVNATQPGYNKLFTGGIADNSGTGIEVGITPVLVATVNFDRTPGGLEPNAELIKIATSAQQGAYAYADNAFNEYPVVASPLGLAVQALPIKLSKFDVRPFGDIKASDLRWTSSSEVNASHFEIERSTDGINFTNIGRVNATGNSNWSIDYDYIDRALPIIRSGVEIYYYRLRMVDLDGSAEYSDIRSIRFDNDDVVIVKMGPNPTTSVLSVNMSSPNTEETEAPANIYDQSGRLVTSKKVNTNGVTEIDFSNFPNAIYNVSIEHNGKTYNNRIIKSN